MHPIIIQIGPLTIYSYGLMLAVAVFVCAYLLREEFKRRKLPAELAFDFVFGVVLSGVVGCRIFYILLNFSFFIDNPAEIFMLQRGGLAWQGGLIAGGLAAIFLVRRNKLPLLGTLDIFAPYVALGQSIGRVGCLLNGCCYGRNADWGLYFPVFDARLHPTQIYESLGLIVVFGVLKISLERPHRDGEVFVLYLALASLLRFIVEFFRADHDLILGTLSIFQIMTLLFMGVAVYVYTHLKSRRG